jgi:hypothetical protein
LEQHSARSAQAGGRWVELRDASGKLQAKYDPAAGVLEIQRRGARMRYVLGEAGCGDVGREIDSK